MIRSASRESVRRKKISAGRYRQRKMKRSRKRWNLCKLAEKLMRNE